MGDRGVMIADAAPAMHAYSIYGVRVTTDIPFSFSAPAADVGSGSRETGVEFVEHDEDMSLRFAQAQLSDDDFVFESAPDGATYLRWRGFYEFTVAGDGSRVRYRRLETCDALVLQNFLFGQVLAVALVRRGVEPLHAAAVRVGDAAVAFLGECTFGKSTLLAAFAHAGYRVLTDDMLILDRRAETMYARPGSGRLKLCPDSARCFPVGASSEPVTPMTSKRSFALDPSRRQASSLPLRSLYVLPDPGDRDRAGAVSIRPASQAEMACELLKGSFTTHVVDRARLLRQFAHATEVASRVDGFRLCYPAGLDRVADVRDAIVRHATARLRARNDGETNE